VVLAVSLCCEPLGANARYGANDLKTNLVNHTMKARINPRVLRWAREELGLSPQEIASRLDIDEQRYGNWETDGTDIPFGKLKDIARLCERQVAVFFLPAAPTKTKRPTDYRNVRIAEQGISKETLLAIRRAIKFRALASTIQGVQYWLDRYDWLKEIRESQTSDTLKWLRTKLDVSLQLQQSLQSPNEALKLWRNSIEAKFGIFVFQFPLPTGEVQGFCFSDTPPYAIVLNSNYAYASRVFTLFHELDHIFRTQSSICFPDQVQESQTLELQCNHFAGEFLVPDDHVPRAGSLQALTAAANRFKVSKEVILFRNLERNFVSKAEFFELLNEIKAQPIPERRSGPIDPIVKSQSSRGDSFFSLVLDSAHKNVIDFNTASDALGLKLNHIANAQ
jgi:Zn-dependent peptidase ImmA (M78 family)